MVALNNGAEALRLLEGALLFDCVLSDISMPVLDGETLASRLATLSPGLPLILMSGNREPASGGEKRLFLEKPIEHQALLQAIARLCGA